MEMNRKLSELVKVDDRFQNSINIQLDLNKIDKVLSYIPTKSSVEILDRYVSNINKDTKEKSTLLIGPYGKGKSHLLLVLLALISLGYSDEEKKVVEKVNSRIRNVSEETANIITEIRENSKKFLPIIISNTQMDLNQAYLVALNEALKRAGLKNIIPNTFYTEAEKVICTWENNYKEAFETFSDYLRAEKKTVEELVIELNHCNREALEQFMEIYPKVTAGSKFNPMINMDIKMLYEEVNHVICLEYGYSGMFIVFDEFSKYIEGHNQETIAIDMKLIQDMCELANRTKENQIHMLMIAHKSIKQYHNVLPKEIINAFTGVEGRLKEILFITSSQNNYELIQNAISKKKEFREELVNSELLKENLINSYSLPAFNTLFEKEDFNRIVVQGCFPLLPLSAYFLLGISEKVAQNERTLFTFISKDEPHSMARFIKNHKNSESYFITADLIFDYFEGIFKTEVSNTLIHAEWLKADYALKQVQTAEEKKIIKTLAIINILNKQDEVPAAKRYLMLGSGLINSDVKECLSKLRNKGIIDYRASLDQYYFKNNIGVDLEREIARKMSTMSLNTSVMETLRHISELDYVMPKVHNQKFAIKRFFDYKFCEYDDFFSILSSEYLFNERKADGKVVLLLGNKEISVDKVMDHIVSLNDDRLVVILANGKFSDIRLVREYQALQLLIEDKKFISDNEVLEQELYLKEEELIFNINKTLKDLFNFGNKKTYILHLTLKNKCKRVKTEKDFNRFISDVCDMVYKKTPIINNEMINKNHISTPIRTARRNLVDKILFRQDTSELNKLTTPEASIYRATLIHSGVTGDSMNEGLEEAIKKIDEFILSCEEKRKDFKELYTILLSKPYGMRLGTIPIYLAFCLRKFEDMPVIYLGDREVRANGEVLAKINDNPEEYSLFLVKGTKERKEYLSNLQVLFKRYLKDRDKEEGIITQVVLSMQRWLQGISMLAKSFEYDEFCCDLTKDEYSCLKVLRKNLSKIECNSRELLFDKIPSQFEAEDLSQCYSHIEKIKFITEQYQSRIQKHMVIKTKEIFKIDENTGLATGLRDWYNNQSESAKTVLLNSRTSNLLSYISRLETFDENEIVNQLTKICLDMHIEDWKQTQVDDYIDIIKQLKQEIELTVDSNVTGKSKITLCSDGKEIVRYYDNDINDSTCYFLKNELMNVLDEFGESLEVNQKVSVLVQLINEQIK